MGDLATTRVREGSVEGSVGRRLQLLGSVVPPLEIAELWVFPPLPEVDASAEFFLFTRIQEGNRRALYSARLLPENGSPARQVVEEHGSVPADRLPRLVGRLQRRLGEHHCPLHVVIDGQAGRWQELLDELLGGPDGPPQASSSFPSAALPAANGGNGSRRAID
jgi:FAD/FMN-containing dehydrogenase